MSGECNKNMVQDALNAPKTKIQQLEINNSPLTRSYEHLSKELKWLCWCKFPSRNSTAEFSASRYLVVLDMQHNNLKQLRRKTWYNESYYAFYFLFVLIYVHNSQEISSNMDCFFFFFFFYKYSKLESL